MIPSHSTITCHNSCSIPGSRSTLLNQTFNKIKTRRPSTTIIIVNIVIPWITNLFTKKEVVIIIEDITTKTVPTNFNQWTNRTGCRNNTPNLWNKHKYLYYVITKNPIIVCTRYLKLVSYLYHNTASIIPAQWYIQQWNYYLIQTWGV